MSQWIEDRNGVIRLPDNSCAVERRARVGEAGLSARAHAPQRISWLAEGLGQAAGAVGAWGEVLARQEAEKQKLEALDWAMGYQDREREMLARMAGMKSKDGYENAVRVAEEWYKSENPELLKKARGGFQKNYLGSFLARSYRAGLSRAYAHRSRELDRYHDQVWEGKMEQALARIEADPENHEQYLAGLDKEYADLNPGADPAYLKAQARRRGEKGLEAAILALGRAGKIDEAERLLRESFGAGAGRSGADDMAGEGLKAGDGDGRALWNAIQDMKTDRLVQTWGEAVAEACQAGSGAEIAARVRQGFDEIAKVEGQERRGRAESRFRREVSFHQMRQAAADLKATEGFLQQADLEAWPPSRMREKLREAEGFSRAAREELGMKIDAGLVNKSTPANREATDRLMVAIDRRQEAGEPLTGLEVEALAWNCGLTTEQIIEVRKYRAEGPKRSYSGRGEVFAASTRRAVRESVMGSNVTEMNVASLVDEELARDPALVQKADRIRLNPFYRYPGGGDDVRAMLENLLPKYKDRDELRSLLAGQGFNFSDKIPIPPEGLTLPRAKVYQHNLEAQEADELILANAQPGLVSSAAELAGGLVGSLPDPLNFIPLAGGFNRAIPGTKLLSRAGLKMLGRSALIGTGENAAGAAMSDAAAFPLANRWGADLGLERAAEDVALAGALGSAFSAAGTSIGHMKAAKPNKVVSAQTRKLLEERLMGAGRTMEEAAGEAEIAIRQHTNLARITGADPNAVIRQKINFAREGDVAAVSYGQGMYRSQARHIQDFINESLANTDKTAKSFFILDNPYDHTVMELSSDQVIHINEGHPDFGDWEIIPEVIVNGEKTPVGKNRTTGTDTFVYKLDDNGESMVVIAAPNVGGRGRKDKPTRTIILSAFRENERAVNNWLATKKAASSPSDGELHLNPHPTEQMIPSGPQGGDSKIAKLEREVNELIGADKKSFLQAGEAGQRGRLDVLPDQTYRVVFTEAADASTAVHEFQHLFIEEARRILELPAEQIVDARAFTALKDGMKAAEGWAGVQGGQWTREAHEKLATAFEHYLAKGEAPTRELQGLFDRMKEWLLSIYKSLNDQGADIPADVRNFFDRQLSLDGERLLQDSGL